MKSLRSVVWVGAACVLFTAALSADTLIMRDGRRVRGQLITVRDGVIEFEGQDGFFGRRERLRIDLADVARIELDDQGRDRDSRDDRTGGRPSGLRERDVKVGAATAWNDTGIEVRAGQAVYFSAAGRVRWGPGRQDGPAGEDRSPYNAGRPSPGTRPPGSSAGLAMPRNTSSSARTRGPSGCGPPAGCNSASTTTTCVTTAGRSG